MESQTEKSGIELITAERNEQIQKHGYTKEWDANYTHGELLKAADYCLNPREGVWPTYWSSLPKYNIAKKSKIGQLACGGAFYMAENDRLGENKYQSEIDEIARQIDKLQSESLKTTPQ
jgi:hypothetical protein